MRGRRITARERRRVGVAQLQRRSSSSSNSYGYTRARPAHLAPPFFFFCDTLTFHSLTLGAGVAASTAAMLDGLPAVRTVPLAKMLGYRTATSFLRRVVKSVANRRPSSVDELAYTESEMISRTSADASSGNERSIWMNSSTASGRERVHESVIVLEEEGESG